MVYMSRQLGVWVQWRSNFSLVQKLANVLDLSYLSLTKFMFKL